MNEASSVFACSHSHAVFTKHCVVSIHLKTPLDCLFQGRAQNPG